MIDFKTSLPEHKRMYLVFNAKTVEQSANSLTLVNKTNLNEHSVNSCLVPDASFSNQLETNSYTSTSSNSETVKYYNVSKGCDDKFDVLMLRGVKFSSGFTHNSLVADEFALDFVLHLINANSQIFAVSVVHAYTLSSSSINSNYY